MKVTNTLVTRTGLHSRVGDMLNYFCHCSKCNVNTKRLPKFLSVIFLHSLSSEEVYLCLPTPSKICLLHFLTPEQHSIYKHGASRATWTTPSLALCDLGPYISIRHRCTLETALTGSCPLKRIYLTYTKTPLRNKHFN